MQPSPAMQALIEQVYHIFRRYPVSQQFVVCCEYCLSQQEQKALRNTSLRAIPYSLINAGIVVQDLIRKTAMRFVIFFLVYWSLLRRGNLTIFTKYFLYGVSTLPVKKTGVRMNGQYCSDLPASIWLIGYLAMRLSNYSICWKCFPVPISLFRHCLMPSSLYPVTNPQYRWHVCCGITGKRIFRIVVLSRMMTIKPLPPKSMPGPSTINPS